MKKIEARKGGANVFRDLGFGAAEAAELTVKSSLIDAIADTIARRKLTQNEAAKICGTDQPTLSKVIRGRMESVTIDRLANWLTALGRTARFACVHTSHGPSPASWLRCFSTDLKAEISSSPGCGQQSGRPIFPRVASQPRDAGRKDRLRATEGD